MSDTYSRWRPSLQKYDRQNRKTRGRDNNEIPDDGEDFVWDLHVGPGVKPPPSNPATHHVILTESRQTDPQDPRIGTRTFEWQEVAWTAEELASLADLEARTAKLARVGQSVSWLRARSDEAEAVVVNSGNAIPTLQAVVDNLAVFYDGFADLLEGQGVDK